MGKAQELKKLVLQEKTIYVQPHNFPDPDGIGSAFALCELIKAIGGKSKIFYHGALQRTIMLDMIADMNIDMNLVDEPVLSPDDKIIVVDCSPQNSNVMDIGGTVIGVIDHHEFIKNLDLPFIDIQPDVGATSTIIAGYYFELGIPVSRDAATALAVGVNIDTAFLSRKITPTDITIYAQLVEHMDVDVMRFITINNLELKDMQYFRNALDHYKMHHNFLFCNIGNNLDSNFTGIVADFFLSIKEVDFVLVISVIDTGIILSVRNIKSEWNAAKVIQTALQGIGTGGGHKHMAGGFVKWSERNHSDIENELFNRFKEVLFQPQ